MTASDAPMPDKDVQSHDNRVDIDRPRRVADLTLRDAMLALFDADAVVTDEGRAWRGSAEIRDWRLGPASKYEYTTTIASIALIDEDHYRASGRIDGNFPGGTAALTWDFSTVGGLISRLEIAP